MKFALKVAVTSLLLGLIVWKMGGLQKLFELLAGLRIEYIVLVLLLNTADRIVMTYKWLRLLRSKSIHISLVQGLRIYCAAMIWGMFLPATIGADAIRVISTSRRGHDMNEIVASVVIERLAGFLSALMLGTAGCILISHLADLSPEFEAVLWLGFTALVLGTVGFTLTLSQGFFDLLHDRILHRFKSVPLMRKVREMHSSYTAYRNNRRELFTFFGLTILEQLFPILITWLIAVGLGVEVGLLFVAGVFPLTLLVARLPVSVNGIGVFEGVFALLLALGGVSAAQAVAIAFSGRILQTIAWLPWWIAEVMGSGTFKPPRTVTDSG